MPRGRLEETPSVSIRKLLFPKRVTSRWVGSKVPTWIQLSVNIGRFRKFTCVGKVPHVHLEAKKTPNHQDAGQILGAFISLARKPPDTVCT